MPSFYRKTAQAAIAVAALFALPAWFLSRSGVGSSGPTKIVENYVKASYSRDFREAYRWLSEQDKAKLDEESYVREQGAFEGFTRRLAARLAGLIEVTRSTGASDEQQGRMSFKIKVPDPDRLSEHVSGWDEERLNALSTQEQNSLIAAIDRMRSEGKIPFREVEEGFDLIKERQGWRILAGGNGGIRVEIVARLPGSAPLEVEAMPRQIVFTPGEPFVVTLKVRNPSSRELWARVAHTVEPEIMAKYMGLADCGAFIPFRLAPGTEKENSSTFLAWTDIPKETRRLAMIYTFEVDE
jgi:hypothetical protein